MRYPENVETEENQIKYTNSNTHCFTVSPGNGYASFRMYGTYEEASVIRNERKPVIVELF